MRTKTLTLMLALILSGIISFAQKSKTEVCNKQPAKTEQQNDSVYYTCSRHPEVNMNRPGKCPICGMVLQERTIKMAETKSVKVEAVIIYTCPLHPEVNMDKPGKCPKCGMDLVEKKVFIKNSQSEKNLKAVQK